MLSHNMNPQESLNRLVTSEHKEIKEDDRQGLIAALHFLKWLSPENAEKYNKNYYISTMDDIRCAAEFACIYTPPSPATNPINIFGYKISVLSDNMNSLAKNMRLIIANEEETRNILFEYITELADKVWQKISTNFKMHVQNNNLRSIQYMKDIIQVTLDIQTKIQTEDYCLIDALLEDQDSINNLLNDVPEPLKSEKKKVLELARTGDTKAMFSLVTVSSNSSAATSSSAISSAATSSADPNETLASTQSLHKNDLKLFIFDRPSTPPSTYFNEPPSTPSPSPLAKPFIANNSPTASAKTVTIPKPTATPPNSTHG